MSRAAHQDMQTAIAEVAAGLLTAYAASKKYGIAQSSISRALRAKKCPCCGRTMPKSPIATPQA